MNVIEILNNIPLIQDGNIEIYDLQDHVINWPEVEYDGDTEALDLENWEILSLNEDKMVMTAGGDWQEPITFTLTAEDGKLRVSDITAGFKDGLSHKKIIDILSK